MGIDFDPTLTPDGKLAAFESKTLEYRRDLSSRGRIIKTLVAFANSSGGSLVVGVADDHSVLGAGDPLVEENRLANMVANGIRPMLLPETEIVTVGERALLVVNVYPAGRRPFYVATDGPDDGVYVRLGSSTVRADQWQIAELRRQATGVVFDELPNPQATGGLDDAAVAAAFPTRDVASANAVLNLRVEDQGATVPTNGGVLLFGKDRERLFPDAGMIEQWGYGVQRMFRRAAELGLPEPSYVELPGRLRFVVPTLHAQIMAGGPRSAGPEAADEPIDTDSLSQHQSQYVSQYQLRLLAHAAHGPSSRTDLLAVLGISGDWRNAKRHIEPLMDAGFLELTDRDNPRRRSQRYRITEAGRAFLDDGNMAP